MRNANFKSIAVFHLIPEPPAITVMTSGPLQGTIVGDPLIISCTAIFVLNVSFVWIGPDGQTVTTGANRVVIPQTTSSDNNHTSSLQFSYLMEGDEGTYTCHGTVMGVIRSNSATIGDLNGMYFTAYNSVCTYVVYISYYLTVVATHASFHSVCNVHKLPIMECNNSLHYNLLINHDLLI